MVEPCFLQKKVKAKIAVYLENKKKILCWCFKSAILGFSSDVLSFSSDGLIFSSEILAFSWPSALRSWASALMSGVSALRSWPSAGLHSAQRSSALALSDRIHMGATSSVYTYI